MLTKKSEAIQKHFIGLKFSTWVTLGSERPVKVFKIRWIFSICQIYWEYRTARPFSVLKTLTKGKETYKTQVLPTCLVEFPSSKDIKNENK